jgi:hypothetical protein
MVFSWLVEECKIQIIGEHQVRYGRAWMSTTCLKGFLDGYQTGRVSSQAVF